MINVTDWGDKKSDVKDWFVWSVPVVFYFWIEFRFCLVRPARNYSIGSFFL